MNIGLFVATNMAMQSTLRQAQNINTMSHHHNKNNNNEENAVTIETDDETLEKLVKRAKVHIPKHLNKKDLIAYLKECEKKELDLLSI